MCNPAEIEKVANLLFNAWASMAMRRKGHWVEVVCVVSTATLSTSAAAAHTWTRGAGVVTVTVDANFTVGFVVEGGWGLQNGGVSEHAIEVQHCNDRMCMTMRDAFVQAMQPTTNEVAFVDPPREQCLVRAAHS